MTTIQFAVLVKRGRGYQVEHLYQHDADADRCVEIYHSHLGLPSLVVDLVPPLAAPRRSDMWALLDPSAKRLHLFTTPEFAGAAALLCERLEMIDSPIRQAMPVQHGIPQFSRS